MKQEERRKLSEILLKFAPLSVAYATGRLLGAKPDTAVEVPMSIIEEAAQGMRDLKGMLYGVRKEGAPLS